MITIEKMIDSFREGADTLADAIIALMKRAYENGYESGYEEGSNEGASKLTDNELDEAFKDGQQEGYLRGREDGYDEACMDLTDDDTGSSLYTSDEEEAEITDCPRR